MSASGPVAWRRFATLADASAALAETVAIRLNLALDARGQAWLAVPGGTTPAGFLAELARQDVSWNKVTLLPTDERFVAPDDPASNERMIRGAFPPLRTGGARFISFHRAGADLAAAAADVDRVLADLPPLDVLVSGMGADGHIASLFPGDPASGRREPALHALPATPPGLPPRISLSPARLAGAAWAALLIAGADKERVAEAAIADPASCPAGLLASRPAGLELFWAEA